MSELFHSLSFLSAGASAALLGAIWQGAVLCAAVVVCLRLLPGLSAAARSVVWFNVFVLVLLLHIVPAFTAQAPVFSARHVAAIRLDPRWSLAIGGLWLSLSLWRGVQLALGAIHLQRLAGRAVAVPVDGELKALLTVPGGRTARLCASDEVARPSVLGFFRPRILVPTVLLETLSPAEMQQVVLHEMEHLRRADDWTNLLQKIGLVLFPLNPVLLWVERRLCAGVSLPATIASSAPARAARHTRFALRTWRNMQSFAARFPWCSAPGNGGPSWCGASTASSASPFARWAADPQWPPPAEYLPVRSAAPWRSRTARNW